MHDEKNEHFSQNIHIFCGGILAHSSLSTMLKFIEVCWHSLMLNSLKVAAKHFSQVEFWILTEPL